MGSDTNRNRILVNRVVSIFCTYLSFEKNDRENKTEGKKKNILDEKDTEIKVIVQIILLQYLNQHTFKGLYARGSLPRCCYNARILSVLHVLY